VAPVAIATGTPLLDLRRLVRRRLAWRPEAWLYAVAVGAGLALLLRDVTGRPATDAHAHHAHHAHHHQGGSTSSVDPTGAATGVGWWLAEWGGWILMVLAMMLPIAAPHARRVAMRSLWHRRYRAMVSFLFGYLAVWFAVGGVLAAVLVAVGQPRPGSAVLAAVLLGAAAWQVSRPRRRVMRRCGAFRAGAIRGWRAERDCAAGGFRIGLRCTFTCGPVMLAMAVGHGVILMSSVLVLLLSERARGPNPDQRAGRPLEAWCLVAYAAMIALGVVPS
jgi:predicted metal-binding membrane protein